MLCGRRVEDVWKAYGRTVEGLWKENWDWGKPITHRSHDSMSVTAFFF